MAAEAPAGMEREMTFSSQLDARQFLVNKITSEAGFQGVALSDVELRLLMLNLNEPETATGIPVEDLDDPTGKHEKKMAALLHAAYHRDKNNPREQRQYKDAVQALENSGHYILIVASAMVPQSRRWGNLLVYALITLAVVGMIWILHVWTRTK